MTLEDGDTALELAGMIKQLLESLPRPAFAPFLADWPAAPGHRAVRAADLPVLRWLAEIARDAAAFDAALVATLCRAAPLLAWRQTYTARDLGAGFLDNYGWSEILGASGPLASERIACGFLLLGPATHYPRHRHEAEEIYLPLSGTAAWQQGDEVWRERPPGTPIHHASEEPHAMRTGARPLLALYIWRSADLSQKAQLEPPGSAHTNARMTGGIMAPADATAVRSTRQTSRGTWRRIHGSLD